MRPLGARPPRSTRSGSPLVLSRVHWVEPKLVAEITYLTWTADNLLRHTVYVGLRDDKPADQVRRAGYIRSSGLYSIMSLIETLIRICQWRVGYPAHRPQAPILTVDQMRRRIDRLNNCIRDLEIFDPQTVQKRYGIPEVMALEAAIDEACQRRSGHGTPAYNRYKDAALLDRGLHIAHR